MGGSHKREIDRVTKTVVGKTQDAPPDATAGDDAPVRSAQAWSQDPLYRWVWAPPRYVDMRTAEPLVLRLIRETGLLRRTGPARWLGRDAMTGALRTGPHDATGGTSTDMGRAHRP
jgi:hypothetical protein